ARGEKVVTFSATDIFGNRLVSSRTFTYDQTPVLTVTEPLVSTVARPLLHLAATCVDDDPAGCQSLRVIIDDGTVVATGTGSIDQTVSLTSLNGSAVNLTFAAIDSAGQRVNDVRKVLVEGSSKLVEVASVNGAILDVQPDRFLYLDTSAGG